MRIAPFWCASDGGSHDSVSDMELTDWTAKFKGGPLGAEGKDGKPVLILSKLVLLQLLLLQ